MTRPHHCGAKRTLTSNPMTKHIMRVACMVAMLGIAVSALATDTSATSRSAKLPDDTAFKTVAGAAKVRFPAGPGKEQSDDSVYDRIMDGFQVGPQRLMLDDGSSLYWGQKYQEGNLQSVIIVDPKGQVRLMAAIDDLMEIARGNQPRYTSLAQYQAALKKASSWDGSPGVDVFVGDEADLARYLPDLKRFLQADLLGFNIRCDEPAMSKTCALASQIDIPIRAYMPAGKMPELRALAVPNAAAASTPPLESFQW